MNKTIPFEDSPSKFYRFSSGSLWVLRDPDVEEGNDDTTASTISTSSTGGEDSIGSATKNQSPLPRQTATRNLIVKESDSRSSVMDVSVFKKKQSYKSKALKKKTDMPMMAAAMQAIVEEDNEDAQTENTATSSNNTEIERLKEISALAKIQAAFEIEARGLPKEEKAKMEKERIDRLRFLAKEQLKMHRSSKRISATSILSMHSMNEDQQHKGATIVTIDTKERMLTDIVSQLERTHSKEWITNYGSLMVEIDSKVSSMYTGDHKITESDNTTRNTSNEDGIEIVVERTDSSLINESYSEEEKEEEEDVRQKESMSTKKGNKWKQRLASKKAAKASKETPIKKDKSIEFTEIFKQEFSQVQETSNNDEEEEPIFVTSTNDLPTGFRQTNELKRISDTFESILTKNNDLPLDDDRSAWTEYIIGDDEGREKYKLNEIKRRRPSYTSYVEETVRDDDEQSYMEFTVVEDETLYDEETVYDEETIVSQARASFQRLRKSIKIASNNERANQITATHGADDQSYMDFTVFDNNTVQVSYVEDDINYVAPEEKADNRQEPRSIPLSAPVETSTIPVTGNRSAQHEAFTSAVQDDQTENKFPIIFANNNSMMDDDEMTQLTMDHALMDCSNASTRMSSYGNYSSRPQQPAFKKETKKEKANSSMYPQQTATTTNNESIGSRSNAATMKSCSSTSKNRIQEILWNDLYSCDMPLVWSAMEELQTILVIEPGSRRHIVDLGGVMAIMGTMEEYFEVEMIQYLCCVVLELLAAMEPDARKNVNELDGVQLIIRSMQDQAESKRVQEAGRAALATICRRY